jgi:pyrimidine-nucleoside phosphorylase
VNFLSLIEAKRDGKILSPDQINELIQRGVAGDIPDYQMAAFLMAVYFQGLNNAETRALTLAMRDSGEKLAFPNDPRPLVDKHSTGGVGDKVSLPLAPLLACLGFRVPMISGRGLGITGGTLDKLDAIPGFKTSLPAERILEIVQTVGCIICGQTERMVPADKALYALRDVTGTVPSIPLIVASILSKKLAEGLDALVLDVKFGAAAFMPTLDQARKLARAMVDLGNECGVTTRALLTRMDCPLGSAAGNWLEVKEAVDCLDGKGPDDLRQLVIACAAHLLAETGKAKNLEEGRQQAVDCLASGGPRKKWDQMLVGQGADLEALGEKLKGDHHSAVVIEIKAPRAGFVSRANARVIGEVIRDCGGGRLTKGSAISYEVGVDRMVKPGREVGKDAVLVRLHAADQKQADIASPKLASAFEITDKPGSPADLIVEVL